MNNTMNNTMELAHSALNENNFISDTTTAHFSQDVMEASKQQPILVDFWAPWCGPCKQLTPLLEKAIKEAKGAVKLVKMNIDDHPAIAGQLGIKSIPAIVAFVDGKAVDGFMGVKSESEIKEFIAKLTGGEEEAMIEEALLAAKNFVEAGELAQAAHIYQQLLQHDPANIAAIAGLADLMLMQNDKENAKQALALAPENNKNDPLLHAIHTKIALLEQAEQLGDEQSLLQRIEANSKDYQALFDLALIYNAKGQRDAAADALLTIMRHDREFEDDGARKQLLQFFEAWGAGDAASLVARRKLSSLLFS